MFFLSSNDMNSNVYIGHVVNTSANPSQSSDRFKRGAADVPHGSGRSVPYLNSQFLNRDSFRLLWHCRTSVSEIEQL